MNPYERNMAVTPRAIEIAQCQSYMFPIGRYRVPMELESAVCRRQHGRDDPVYPLWFGHQESLP